MKEETPDLHLYSEKIGTRYFTWCITLVMIAKIDNSFSKIC